MEKRSSWLTPLTMKFRGFDQFRSVVSNVGYFAPKWRNPEDSFQIYSWEMQLFHLPNLWMVIQFPPAKNKAVAPPDRSECVLNTSDTRRWVDAAHLIHWVTLSRKFPVKRECSFIPDLFRWSKKLIAAATGHIIDGFERSVRTTPFFS